MLASILSKPSNGKFNKLLHCSIANNKLNDSSLSIILKGAAKSDWLESLDISGNRIGRTSSIELGCILSECSLEDSSNVMDIAIDTTITDSSQYRGKSF